MPALRSLLRSAPLVFQPSMRPPSSMQFAVISAGAQHTTVGAPTCHPTPPLKAQGKWALLMLTVMSYRRQTGRVEHLDPTLAQERGKRILLSYLGQLQQHSTKPLQFFTLMLQHRRKARVWAICKAHASYPLNESDGGGVTHGVHLGTLPASSCQARPNSNYFAVS